MHPLIISFHARTGSRQAEMILKNWAEVRPEWGLAGNAMFLIAPVALALQIGNAHGL